MYLIDVYFFSQQNGICNCDFLVHDICLFNWAQIMLGYIPTRKGTLMEEQYQSIICNGCQICSIVSFFSWQHYLFCNIATGMIVQPVAIAYVDASTTYHSYINNFLKISLNNKWIIWIFCESCTNLNLYIHTLSNAFYTWPDLSLSYNFMK